MRPSPEWRNVPIRDVTLKTRTWNPQTEPRNTIRYVDVSAVSRETLAIEAADELSAATAPSRARKIIKSGDTIFATIRPSLKRVAQVPAMYDDEIASTAFCVLRPNKTVVDPDFLYFFASDDAFVEEVAGFQTGASYPAVRDSDILDREIPLPPLPDQKQIATVLHTVRDAMLLQVNSRSVAQELKRAAMQELFTRGLRGEVQKETEIGLVPESWEIGKLGQFARFQRGFDITKSEQSQGRIPVVSSGGIRSYHNEVGAKGPGVVIGRKGSIGSFTLY
jgi:type I restriction enzyme, S subunit